MATYPQRPGERITWREQFTSSATVAANGGTLVGAPTVHNGLHLDGATQSATFALSGGDCAGDRVSIVCEFTPDFAWNEDAARTIFSTSGADGYSVYHRAGDFRLGLSLGDSGIGLVQPAVYAEHWRPGQKNTIVVSGQDAGTDMYLNGVLIMDDDGEAWSFTAPTTLYAGSNNAGAELFRGTVHSIDFRHGRLHQDDATFFERRGLGGPWRYRTDAMCWIDTKHHFTDNAGLISTRDKSAHGRDFLVLEGASAINAPRFQAPGYWYDTAKGVGYLRYVPELDLPVANELSFVMAFTPKFFARENATRTFFDTAGACEHLAVRLDNGDSNALRIYLGGAAIDSLSLAEYEYAWRPYGLNVLVVAGKSGDSCAWLNGQQIMAHNASPFTARTVPSCYVGATSAGADGFSGMVYHFSIIPYKVLPMQVHDITELMRSVYPWG